MTRPSFVPRWRRSAVVATLVVVATTLAAFVALSPTADATSYRYWTYWLGGTGPWTFSSRGADRVPADGSVDGWRFAVSEEAASSSTPRVPSSFRAICGDTDPVADSKRIGLVIDFGTAGEAPPGENPPGGAVARCVVVPTSANAYEVLVAATSIRVVGGLVCGIGGYPSSGCGEAVADPKPTDTATNDPKDEPDQSDGHTQRDGGSPGTNAGGELPTTAATGDVEPNKHEKGSRKNQDEPQGQGDDRLPGSAVRDEDAPKSTPTADALTAAAEASLPSTNSGSPMGLLVGFAVLALLTAIGVTFARRRR